MSEIAPIPIRTAASPTSASSTSPEKELRRLRRATADFEALFLSHLLQSMWPKASQTTGSGYGGETMTAIAQEKVAGELAQHGALGLGDMLFEALKNRVVNEGPSDHEEKDRGEPIPVDGLGRDGRTSPQMHKIKARPHQSMPVEIGQSTRPHPIPIK